MSEPKEQEKSLEHLEELVDLMKHGTLAQVNAMLASLHPAEIASLLESLPPAERTYVWGLVPNEQRGPILVTLADEVRTPLIRQMDRAELIAATEGLDIDDLVDFLQDLPDPITNHVLRAMDEQYRRRVEEMLSYPEDTAGGLMNTDAISVRGDITLDVVLRYLRWHGELPEMTDSLMVVNREGKYLGIITLADLLTKDPGMPVGQAIARKMEAIPASMPATEVAKIFERRDLVSAPVVDEEGKLLGRITIDDVVDVIREEADYSFMRMAGLSEESDMFAPVVASSRRRAIWLGVNLLTALLASWVIGWYEGTIEKLVALAVLMPIVASMGGIAGSQTLTLVIRGIALGQIGETNARRLMVKELAVGALNGTIWAMVVSLVVIAWFGDLFLGLVIAAAILINLIAAAFAGATLPLLLRRMGVDPALAGSVILTTVTDVVGFMTFLGLATIFLV
ncbi:MAG: magnesium transporter [Gammaproteobacteria bacterium RBG_16_57_12]|nr:MAG: magnesium transporter [Gammaproteobacteria bacterium RBG_16_57_12]